MTSLTSWRCHKRSAEIFGRVRESKTFVVNLKLRVVRQWYGHQRPSSRIVWVDFAAINEEASLAQDNKECLQQVQPEIE